MTPTYTLARACEAPCRLIFLELLAACIACMPLPSLKHKPCRLEIGGRYPYDSFSTL